jgi:uncharacterized membrane protein HdeD (DUF308 family)
MDNFQQNAAKFIDPNIKTILQKHWKWLLGLGIALVILGTISIFVAALTTIISVILIGTFLILNGAMLVYQAFKVWWHHWRRFSVQLIMGLLYLFAGFIFVLYPIQGAVSLTLVLAVFYIIIGIYRFILALSHKTPGWGWLLFSGLLTAVLGFIVLGYWPAISLWVIGVFVGIDILFIGWAFIMTALAVKLGTTSA